MKTIEQQIEGANAVADRLIAVLRENDASPLARVLLRGWGCDVHHSPFQACYLGDCEFGMIHFHKDLKHKEVQAAGALIGAAPALLKTLEDLLAHCEQIGVDCGATVAARNAIAQARPL